MYEWTIRRNKDGGIDIKAREFQAEAKIKGRLISYKMPNCSTISYILNIKYHLVIMSRFFGKILQQNLN